ncbi:MAG: hypothetical protein KDA28_03335, partial [Phycisphaerales bacterium]|nr:hypothetical protein [Phycisphaerales bacterium]
MFGRKRQRESERLYASLMGAAATDRCDAELAAVLGAPADVQREVLRAAVDDAGPDGSQHGYRLFHHRIRLVRELLARSPSLDADDLAAVVAWSAAPSHRGAASDAIVAALVRLVADRPLPATLAEHARTLRETLRGMVGDADVRRTIRRLDEVLGETPSPAQVAAGTTWGEGLGADITALSDGVRPSIEALLAHAATADGAKPKKAWVKEAGRLLASTDVE